jgi:hypothetical protein
MVALREYSKIVKEGKRNSQSKKGTSAPQRYISLGNINASQFKENIS